MDFHDLDGDGLLEAPGHSGCLHPTNVREINAVPEPGFVIGLGLGLVTLIGGRARARGRRTAC